MANRRGSQENSMIIKIIHPLENIFEVPYSNQEDEKHFVIIKY